MLQQYQTIREIFFRFRAKLRWKKWVSLCSANAWIGTHVTFPVILKRCCRFSVQSFQFEFTTHLMYLQGKHSQSVDRKYNYRECWCYIIRIKQCFPRTNQWLLLMFLQFVCKQSDENHLVHECPFLAVIFLRFFQCVMTVSWNQPQPGCWNYLYYIFIHSCQYTTQHFK